MAFDFKKEEDVKDYLKNLEVQYNFGCHEEKNPEACHLLGDFIEAVKKDFPLAAKAYKNACDEHNFPRSCHVYGSYLMTGRGLPKSDFLEAYRYYSKGCELGYADSCCNAGLMLTSRDEKLKFLQSLNRGVGILKKGCDLRSAQACFFLSGIYLSGTTDGNNTIAKDMSLAAKYSKMGCDLDNMMACANLSIMYRKGDGVEKDEKLAEQCKSKAVQLQKQHNDQLLLNFQRDAKT